MSSNLGSNFCENSRVKKPIQKIINPTVCGIRYAAYHMPIQVAVELSAFWPIFGLYDKKKFKKISSRIQNNINTPCTPRKSRLPN